MSDSYSNNTSKYSSFAGEAFSNNLLSDLAPILTLFGELVTKQFLSLSLGWADNILIALGPLGIMTILVSAIRVSGERRLKALIGRARESKATAEAELLSSTSSEVCEMWNGNEIVRTYGIPETIQLVITHDDSGHLDVCSALDAYKKMYLVRAHYHVSDYDDIPLQGAPNLTLNVPGANLSHKELWLWVLVGSILQIAALVSPAAILMYADGRPRSSYGYVCYVIGTVSIAAGLALSSHVIEGSTTEFDYMENPVNQRPSDPLQIITVQQKANVGEQLFSAYMTACEKPVFRISRMNSNDYRKITVTAVLLTVCGFITQFIGLRAIHWSATITTLVLTIIMMSIRAWVRRGLASEANFSKLTERCEAVDIAACVSEHVRIKISNRVTGPTLSGNQGQSAESSKWNFTPPRLVTATALTNNLPREGTFNPIVSPAEFLRAPSIKYDVGLIAKFQSCISTCPEDVTIAEQLVRAMLEVLNDTWRNPEFSWYERENVFDIVWDLHLTRNCIGSVESQEHRSPNSGPQSAMVIPQMYRMKAFRKAPSRKEAQVTIWELSTWDEVTRIWELDLDCSFNIDAARQICAILEMDRRAYMPYYPADISRRGYWPSRIIGSIPRRNESYSDAEELAKFHKWLDGTFLNLWPPSDDPNIKTNRPRSGASTGMILGCRYSSAYTNILSAEKTHHCERKKDSTGIDPAPHADVYVQLSSEDSYNQCALEIFQIFMLALTSHLRPLTDVDAYKDDRNMSTKSEEEQARVLQCLPQTERPYVMRHRLIEKMVNIVIGVAPKVFRDKETARYFLVPAFLYYDLLAAPSYSFPVDGLDCDP